MKFYSPKSKRVDAYPVQLRDILSAKMEAIDPEGFSKAVSTKNGNYLAGLAAQACSALKIREKTNKNDGVMVELIQKVGGGRKGWAWCMYEVQACVGIAEILTDESSDFPYSGSCASVRNAAKKIEGIVVPIERSEFGDCWIKVYANGTGHTGIFEKWIKAGSTAYLNEGNTSGGSDKPGGPVVREGGGSYRTARDIKKDNWIMAVRPYPLDGAPVIKDKAGVIPKLGDRSDAVAALQRALNAQGYKLTVDAWFGDFTKKAVSAFQKSHGLPGSGILGKKTMKLLSL